MAGRRNTPGIMATWSQTKQPPNGRWTCREPVNAQRPSKRKLPGAARGSWLTHAQSDWRCDAGGLQQRALYVKGHIGDALWIIFCYQAVSQFKVHWVQTCVLLESGPVGLVLWVWSCGSGLGSLVLWVWSWESGLVSLVLWVWSCGSGLGSLVLWVWSCESGLGSLVLGVQTPEDGRTFFLRLEQRLTWWRHHISCSCSWVYSKYKIFTINIFYSQTKYDNPAYLIIL